MRQASNAPRADWLPTGQAARALGCSPDTLKRRGPHRQSPWVWNIHTCYEAICWQGRLGSRIAVA